MSKAPILVLGAYGLGRVPVGPQLFRVEAPPATKLILCHHPSGHHSVLANKPDPKTQPIILFSNFPK
ncbi:MAG: hypothetical protein NT167_15235 [Verrucomicrobia bacterium]|nr:hypothetical protein [Verrucomicrobiota bacterium]